MHRAARPLQPGLPASPKPRDNVPRQADCCGSRTQTLLLVGTVAPRPRTPPSQFLLFSLCSGRAIGERTPTRGSSGILSDPAPTHLPGTRPPGLPPARLYHGERHHRTPTSTAAAAQLMLPRRALLGRAAANAHWSGAPWGGPRSGIPLPIGQHATPPRVWRVLIGRGFGGKAARTPKDERRWVFPRDLGLQVGVVFGFLFCLRQLGGFEEA